MYYIYIYIYAEFDKKVFKCCTYHRRVGKRLVCVRRVQYSRTIMAAQLSLFHELLQVLVYLYVTDWTKLCQGTMLAFNGVRPYFTTITREIGIQSCSVSLTKSFRLFRS